MTRPEDWAIASDVDGTWTPKSVGALVKLVDDHALPESANEEMIALRELYTPKAIAGLLSQEDEMHWLLRTLDVYVHHGLTRTAWQTALEGVATRPGVAETFAWCAAVGIPTCAISYGVADFVEFIASRNGVKIDAVYAARLVHDGDLVVGYDDATLIVPERKGERSRHFADSRGVAHDRLIGIGDTGGDKLIGHLAEHRIGIAENDEQAAKLHALGAMGEIHVGMSFDPVLASIKRRTGLP